MRADPKLTRGPNKLWIRFFLVAVYATMYVRDHARPAFHTALGIDPTDYDYRVFRICSEITKQTFPMTLDIDNPGFRRGMERMRQITEGMADAKAKGGIAGALRRVGLGVQAAATFVGLYLTPVVSNEVPADVRLVPAW